jgi:hypothetical protein
VAANCKPGNGYGDKNHCHSGPPGQNNNGQGFAGKLVNFVRPDRGSGLAVIALAGMLALFALTPALRRRRS